MPDGSVVRLQQALLQYCVALVGRVEGGWLYTAAYIFFWWLVLWQLYRRQIFWRV
jgi:predicted acyltransferase